MKKAASRANVLLNNSVPFLKIRWENVSQGCTIPKNVIECILQTHSIQYFVFHSPSKSNGQSSPNGRSHKSTKSEYGHYGGPEESEHLCGDFRVVALCPCLINEVLYRLIENTIENGIKTVL